MTERDRGPEAAAQEREARSAEQAAPGDFPTEGEAVSVEQVLAEKDAQIDALRSEVLYQQAEVENFKKRTEKRYRDALEFAAEPLLRDLLPVLDNLERAVAHAAPGDAGGGESLAEGLEHVIRQFHETLGRHGVAPIEALGTRFDPSFHEAMIQVPGDEAGLVADVYETGFTFKGRLLRPAKVSVTAVAAPKGNG